MCMLTRGQPSYNSTYNPKSQYLYNKFPKDMRKRVARYRQCTFTGLEVEIMNQSVNCVVVSMDQICDHPALKKCFKRLRRKMLTYKPSLKPHKCRIYRAALRWEPNVVCIGTDPARAYEQWQKLGVKCLDSPSLVFEASSFEPLDSFIRTLDKANSGN